MNEMFVTYLDFELEIGRGRGREYPLAVIHSPVGEAHATMRFPYDELALQKRLVVVQNALLDSGAGPGPSLSPEVLVVRDFGRDLFDALFTGEVRRCYEESIEHAWQQNKRIRLKLRFQPPDLAALPWEFLYDPRRADYICLSGNIPLVRYVELPQTVPPLSLSPPLRILGMIASPGDLDHLHVAREKEWVETALHGLQTRGLVELTWLNGHTWHVLQETMQRGDWHVFHFLGQGDLAKDRLGDKGFMALAGEEGETRRLSAAGLARLLADHRSLRVAALSARPRWQEGQPYGRDPLRNIFTSIATLLVREGVPAVLAVPHQIKDEAAIALFRAFYEALALGTPVDAAVAEARQAVNFAAGNAVEWGVPALFMSSPDGLVFTPVQAQEIEEPPQVLIEPETPPEVTEPEPEPVPAIPLQEAEEPPHEPEPEPKPVPAIPLQEAEEPPHEPKPKPPPPSAPHNLSSRS